MDRLAAFEEMLADVQKQAAFEQAEMDRLKAAEQLSKCYGLYTDKEKMAIEREKLAIEKERLELEKQRNNVASGDEDQYGVVVLAPILEEGDDNA